MDVRFLMVDGARMAMLPAEDYQRLADAAEDRADARAAQAAEDRRAAGEEYLPIEMAERIVAGETALRVWRRHRGLTLSKLGGSAGIRPSYLSEIELGKKPGSPGIWRKLATALDTEVDDIMP